MIIIQKLFQSMRLYHQLRQLSGNTDIVIVANNYAKEVYAQAVELGYDMSKFVFIYNNFNFEDMNRNYELAERVFSPHI